MEILGGTESLARILSGISLFVLALPVAKEAAGDLRRNPFNGHVLMSIAALVAALIGVWLEVKLPNPPSASSGGHLCVGHHDGEPHIHVLMGMIPYACLAVSGDPAGRGHTL